VYSNYSNIKDIFSLQKIICRYKKQQQILTFLSSIYQDEDPGQKFPYFWRIPDGRSQGTAFALVKIRTTRYNNYNPFFQITSGVVEDFG